MLWEGLKLMGIGMATVMLFLLLMIACIEWVKHLTRNYTLLQQQALNSKRKSSTNSPETDTTSAVPIEEFAAAISTFESENNSTKT